MEKSCRFFLFFLQFSILSSTVEKKLSCSEIAAMKKCVCKQREWRERKSAFTRSDFNNVKSAFCWCSLWCWQRLHQFSSCICLQQHKWDSWETQEWTWPLNFTLLQSLMASVSELLFYFQAFLRQQDHSIIRRIKNIQFFLFKEFQLTLLSTFSAPTQHTCYPCRNFPEVVSCVIWEFLLYLQATTFVSLYEASDFLSWKIWKHVF